MDKIGLIRDMMDCKIVKVFDFWMCVLVTAASILALSFPNCINFVLSFVYFRQRLYYFIFRATSVLKAPSKLNVTSRRIGRESEGSGQKGFNKRRGEGGSVPAFQESSREPPLMRLALHRSIWGFSVDRGSHVCSCLACFKLASPPLPLLTSNYQHRPFGALLRLMA